MTTETPPRSLLDEFPALPRYQTVPDEESVRERMAMSFTHMTVDTNYFAAYIPNALTPAECDRIIASVEGEGPEHNWPWCDATGRRFADNEPALRPLTEVANAVAREVWPTYEFHREPVGRLQSYTAGQGYRRHADSGPGAVCWKVIAVALVSDETTYGGGVLTLDPPGQEVPVPRDRGGVILFQPHLPHFVTPVTWGQRHAVNAGFWGPAWR